MRLPLSLDLRTWSFSGKLLVSTLALTVVPMVAVVLLSLRAEARAINDEAAHALEIRSHEIADGVAESLHEFVEQLSAVASSRAASDALLGHSQSYDATTDAVNERRAALLAETWTHAREVAGFVGLDDDGRRAAAEMRGLLAPWLSQGASLALFDTRGVPVLSSGPLRPMRDTNAAWWRRTWADGAGGIDVALVRVAQDTPLLRVAVPVPCERGGVRGVLLAHVPAPTLLAFLDRMPLGETGRVRVLASDGDVVHDTRAGAPDPDPSPRTTPHAGPGTRALIKRFEDGRREVVAETQLAPRQSERLAGRARARILTAIEQLNWNVRVSQDPDETLLHAGRLAATTLTMLGVVTILAACAAFVLTRKLTQGLAELRDAAEELASGKLDVSIPEAGTDDFGQLAGAFRSMVEQQRDVVRSLRERELQLREQVVAGREVATRAENANDELRKTNEAMKIWNDKIELLGKLTETLHDSESQEEILRTAASFCARLFAGLSGAIYLAERAGAIYSARVTFGPDGAQDEGRAIEREDCRALRRAKPYDNRIGKDPEPPCRHLDGIHTPHSLCLPMITKRQGAIGFLHLREPVPDKTLRVGRTSAMLGEQDEQLASMVADHLRLAMADLLLREELTRQAIRDVLTGLFNRRFMEETLDKEVERARRSNTPISVVVLDIDHFKSINDRYGHGGGDAVLACIAEMIEKSIRRGDLACRYGGEEFVIVMPNAEREVACRRVQELLARARTTAISHERLAIGPVTLSAGVATLGLNGDTPQELLRAADAALYRAKASGRDALVVA